MQQDYAVSNRWCQKKERKNKPITVEPTAWQNQNVFILTDIFLTEAVFFIRPYRFDSLRILFVIYAFLKKGNCEIAIFQRYLTGETSELHCIDNIYSIGSVFFCSRLSCFKSLKHVINPSRQQLAIKRIHQSISHGLLFSFFTYLYLLISVITR